ncbi:MAG: PilZ domain-containing protein [Gammaproteobacteria bacterium]
MDRHMQPDVRVPVCLPVRLYRHARDVRAPAPGATRDLSLDGAFVTSPQAPWPPGTTLECELQLDAVRSVVVAAVVTRRTTDGIGVRFADCGDEVLHRLASVLEQEVQRRHRRSR